MARELGILRRASQQKEALKNERKPLEAGLPRAEALSIRAGRKYPYRSTRADI